jgi:hypothetical protein
MAGRFRLQRRSAIRPLWIVGRWRRKDTYDILSLTFGALQGGPYGRAVKRAGQEEGDRMARGWLGDAGHLNGAWLEA